MGVLVRVTFDKDTGKVKYLQENEKEIEDVKKLVQFVNAHKGEIAYKYFMDKEEVNFSKKLPSYYRMVMLEPLCNAMRADYKIESVHETDALLSVFFLKTKKKKADGTDYEIPMRIENVPFATQVEFIAKVANFAITKYQIKFPNANEVDGLSK